MVSFTKLTVLAFIATALADDGVMIYHKGDLALAACTALLQKNVLYFGKKDKVGYCNTKLPQALGSMAVCLKQLPTDSGVQAFIESCTPYKLTQEQFDDAYKNSSHYLVTNTNGYPGFNLTKPFSHPIKMKQKTVIGGYQSEIGRYYNYNRANYYGWVLILYWTALVLFAGVLNLFSSMFPKQYNSFNGKVSNAYKRYVTMPALGREKKVAHGRFLKFIEFVIPTRLESLYIAVWCIMALAFNVANYHHDSPNLFWKEESAEIGRKIADRTGIMVLYVIPQLVLFAGRNNFMEWISGWSYQRFNVIHHWQSRVAFLLMMVHAVGMTYNSIGLGKYQSRNAKPYVRWGYVALVASAIMCFHSLAIMRKKNYEMFVLAHNVLAAIFIAGTWIHVADDKFQTLMYAATAVWCFDKAARLVRMVYFGVKTADVQLIASETLRVTVPRPSYWRPNQLSYAFVYFFRPSCFWQSHPFTIVDSVVGPNVISFYIKVKGGMTNSLYQYLSKQPDQRTQIKCSIEGPYGSNVPLQHYKTVSYLSGGNGIPGPFSSAIKLAKKDTGQKLKLYWVIRHWKSIEWFYSELKSLQGLPIETVIFVTAFNTPLDNSFIEKFSDNQNSQDVNSNPEKDPSSYMADDNEENASMENAARIMSKLYFIEFRAGRPDLEAIVKADISESNGAVAFVAAGHETFVDKSRKAVIDNLVEGKRVDFVDTMQQW